MRHVAKLSQQPPRRQNAPSTPALPADLKASTTQTPLALPAKARPETPEMRQTRLGEALWSEDAPRLDLPDHRREQEERKEERDRWCRDKTRRNQLTGGEIEGKKEEEDDTKGWGQSTRERRRKSKKLRRKWWKGNQKTKLRFGIKVKKCLNSTDWRIKREQ